MIIKENKGLSAIGLQFVLFIISVFILGYSNNVLNSNYSQVIYNLNKSTMDQFHSNLNVIVNNLELCRSSFKPDSFANEAAIKIFKPGSTTDVFVQEGMAISSTWKINSIKLKNIVTDNSTPLILNKAEIEIIYESNAVMGLNSVPKRPKIIPIYYTLSGSVLEDCFGENSAAFLCAKLGAKYDPLATPKCLPPAVLSKKCDTSKAINSITTMGELACI